MVTPILWKIIQANKERLLIGGVLILLGRSLGLDADATRYANGSSLLVSFGPGPEDGPRYFMLGLYWWFAGMLALTDVKRVIPYFYFYRILLLSYSVFWTIHEFIIGGRISIEFFILEEYFVLIPIAFTLMYFKNEGVIARDEGLKLLAENKLRVVIAVLVVNLMTYVVYSTDLFNPFSPEPNIKVF